MTQILNLGVAAASPLSTTGEAGLRSRAIAPGGGLGAVGTGVGVGTVSGSA